MALQGYYAPNSVEEVISLLLESASQSQLAKLLAGGTDVLVQMHSGLNKPDVLVNLKKVKETNRLDINDREIYIGAAIPSAQMQEHQNLKELFYHQWHLACPAFRFQRMPSCSIKHW